MTKKPSLFLIFLTILIDMLGVGIIIPVIPALFFDAGSEVFNGTFTDAEKSVLYGFLIASYPIMQFFGAPILGALSDRFGRRPVLTFSLIGTFIGYLLFAWAIYQQNIVWMFLSRMLPGFMGGNVSIILSAISDISTAEERTKNFGLVGMAFGLGFIIGPTLGGLLADDSLVSWFTHATPFLFTAGLTLLNIIIVWIQFPETLTTPNPTAINPFRGIRNIATSFSTPNLRSIFSVVLLLSLGFSFFTQFFSVYLIQVFSYSEKSIGLLYGWVGIWLAITQGVFVRRATKKFSPYQVIPFSILGLACAMILLIVPSQDLWFYAINPLIAIAQGMTSPNLTTIVSKQVGVQRQGEIMGINTSMQSLGQAIPPVIAGFMNAIHPALPIVAASVLIFLAWVVYMLFFKKRPIVEVG